MVLLLRQVSNAFIPAVDLVEDKEEFDHLFALHVEKKRLLQDLLVGGVPYEEVLEALEAYIGTSNMDSYIEETEQKLELIICS